MAEIRLPNFTINIHFSITSRYLNKTISIFLLHLADYFLDLPVTNFGSLGYVLYLLPEKRKMLAFAHLGQKTKSKLLISCTKNLNISITPEGLRLDYTIEILHCPFCSPDSENCAASFSLSGHMISFSWKLSCRMYSDFILSPCQEPSPIPKLHN